MVLKKAGLYGLFLFAILLTACSQGNDDEAVESFSHIHGLAYDLEDPSQLYMSTHMGLLRISDENEWNWVGDITERHDLMGFTFKDENTMISSGHPNVYSNLENPLGIVISKNKGESWEPISLHGDIDFHVLEVNTGDSNVIYGIDMYESVLYVSNDGGYNWTTINADGLPRDYSKIISLVSNPLQPEMVIAGSEDGIYLSEDGGQSWRVTNQRQSMTSGASIPSGEIFVYLLGNDAGLYTSEDFGETWIPLSLQIEDDAITHIAVHPTNNDTITVGTFREDLYQTMDGGKNWIKIAEAGQLK